MRQGRERNRQRAIARNERVKPWGDLPRGSSPSQGVLFIDKDQGVTSHDVVGAIRRLGATRQVGHAGTLDPMATGLLIVATGRTTKLIQYLVGAEKTYEARICLGVGSDTDDADGQLYAASAPELGEGSEERVDKALAALTGDILQVPATVSAIKVDGLRAHDLARAGHDVELEARPIHVSRFERTSTIVNGNMEIAGESVPTWQFDVVVTASAGTYVRALARDVGRALGTQAHLRSLRRTRIGPWDVANAVRVADLRDCVEREVPLPVAKMAEICRAIFPVIEIDDAEEAALRNGIFIEKRKPVSQGARSEPWPAAAFKGDRPVALVSPRSGRFKPDLQLSIEG
ncbi:tRNA pseudouridine55 synthase [Trueperella bonasi]|uniref:tRNA pseudouridine synthase B n=1 Tax=Trueperella bonasi TaxID=312286 RepID=A0ABT9NHT4_9ACTO|nr:tRNA pseudouridine(55) synthase TruB [Trueperella bonasi]MDP9806966.1 tRNA pseudouridine55 synthase [Trueperella bonasi]